MKTIKIKSADIKTSAVKRENYPQDGLPCIAFVGRSNVGKSSTINTLLNRKTLARVSQRPGKTRTINFYIINNEFYFVDLPGYGYAKLSKGEQENWGRVMQEYFEDNPNLKHLFLLLDIRHEPKDTDIMMYEYCKHYGIELSIIATKSDKITRNKYQKSFKDMKNALNDKSLEIIPFSSLKKTGVNEVWSRIIDVLEDTQCQITIEDN